MDLQRVDNKLAIKKGNISLNHYTISLLKEAFRVGLMDKSLIDRIQTQIVLILKDIIMRYTKGESTSVMVETAEKQLNSIYYSIDACIKSYNNLEDAIDILKTKDIKEIYEEGLKIVVSCFEETKALYDKVLKNKLDVSNIAYNTTIDDGLPGFFKNYGIVFNAQDTMADIDYPLAFDDMSISGVFYFKQYLEKLDIENRFCGLFSSRDIEDILIGYGRKHGIDYRVPLINIFEILLNNSIFSVISGSSGKSISISKLQYELIEKKLKNISRSQISSVVEQAMDKVIVDLVITDSELAQYICRYGSEFTVRVLNAVENGSLHSIVITADERDIGDGSIVFEDNKRMDDDSFRSVVNKILVCSNVKDKVGIIKSNVCSLDDFIDILNAECLFEDEFDAVFGLLSDMELSILGRIIFADELRNGHLKLLSINAINEQKEWQLKYVSFVRGLSGNRVDTIEKYINSIA